MTFNPRRWEPVAWILAALNVVSVWVPAPVAPWHATTHAVLAVSFALWAQHLRRLGRRSAPEESTGERLSEPHARSDELGALRDVQSRVAELEERLDFVERALIDVRARTQLPPKA